MLIDLIVRQASLAQIRRIFKKDVFPALNHLADQHSGAADDQLGTGT
ncbi:MAG: hypothetical protein LBI68_04730 [Azoarcus sp.]|jgi:hypothetical protein|nr:hypothetical protein [Azoarcus sp.]